MILKILIPYLVLINLIGLLSMRLDKRRAIAHKQRIPEKRLFAYALLGGSIGCILGMLIFRHKTKHLPFTIGMPVILLVQAAVVVFGYSCFVRI